MPTKDVWLKLSEGVAKLVQVEDNILLIYIESSYIGTSVQYSLSALDFMV